VVAQLDEEHFYCLVAGYDDTWFARSGLYGAVHDGALYIVGSLETCFHVGARRLFPGYVEHTTQSLHQSINLAALCTYHDLVIVAIEVASVATGGLIKALAPVVTAAIIERHSITPHVLIFVEPGQIPLDLNGGKMRIQLRDAFIAGLLTPRLVVFNRRL